MPASGAAFLRHGASWLERETDRGGVVSASLAMLPAEIGLPAVRAG